MRKLVVLIVAGLIIALFGFLSDAVDVGIVALIGGIVVIVAYFIGPGSDSIWYSAISAEIFLVYDLRAVLHYLDVGHWPQVIGTLVGTYTVE